MPAVLDLQSWADNLELVRLPQISSDILGLQVEISATTQTFLDQLDAHSVRIDAAQAMANSAQLAAADTSTTVYQTGLDARVYTDIKIQQLSDAFLALLGPAITPEMQQAIANAVASDISAGVTAASNSAAAAEQARIAASNTAAALNAELLAVLEDIDQITNVVLPSQDAAVAQALSDAFAAQSRISLLLDGYAHDALVTGIDGIQAASDAASVAANDAQAAAGDALDRALRAPIRGWSLDPTGSRWASPGVLDEPDYWIVEDGVGVLSEDTISPSGSGIKFTVPAGGGRSTAVFPVLSGADPEAEWLLISATLVHDAGDPLAQSFRAEWWDGLAWISGNMLGVSNADGNLVSHGVVAAPGRTQIVEVLVQRPTGADGTTPPRLRFQASDPGNLNTQVISLRWLDMRQATETEIEAGPGGSLRTSITAEEITRQSADNALSALITTLQSDVGSNSAAISAETIARTSADDAIAATVVTLQTAVDANASAITSEQIARSTAVDSLAADITSLQTNVSANAAAISSEQLARTTSDDSLASDITTLQTDVGANAAAISAEQLARTTAVDALAADITSLQTSTGDNAAAISAEQVARTTAVDAVASSVTSLQTTVNANSSWINTTGVTHTTPAGAVAAVEGVVAAAGGGSLANVTNKAVSSVNAAGAVAANDIAVSTATGGLLTSVSSLALVASDLDGNAGAAVVLRAGAAGLTLTDFEGTPTSLRIAADQLVISDGSLNLIPNGDFRHGDLQGWVPGASPYSVVSATSGISSALLTAPAPWVLMVTAQASFVTQTLAQNISVTVGDTFFFSFDYGGGGSSPINISGQMLFRWYDRAGTLVSTSTGTESPLHTSVGWAPRFSGTITAPTGAVRLDIQFRRRLNPSDGAAFFANLLVVRQATGATIITPQGIDTPELKDRSVTDPGSATNTTLQFSTNPATWQTWQSVNVSVPVDDTDLRVDVNARYFKASDPGAVGVPWGIRLTIDGTVHTIEEDTFQSHVAITRNKIVSAGTRTILVEHKLDPLMRGRHLQINWSGVKK